MTRNTGIVTTRDQHELPQEHLPHLFRPDHQKRCLAAGHKQVFCRECRRWGWPIWTTTKMVMSEVFEGMALSAQSQLVRSISKAISGEAGDE